MPSVGSRFLCRTSYCFALAHETSLHSPIKYVFEKPQHSDYYYRFSFRRTDQRKLYFRCCHLPLIQLTAENIKWFKRAIIILWVLGFLLDERCHSSIKYSTFLHAIPFHNNEQPCNSKINIIILKCAISARKRRHTTYNRHSLVCNYPISQWSSVWIFYTFKEKKKKRERNEKRTREKNSENN